MQGNTINGFELKSLLGRGGMAEVWYAENEIGKPAAVKILNEDLSHNAQTVDRFRNEAVVMVKLDHPNIRQVYGYGTIDGRPCIVMEYLEGNDLKARMKQGQRFAQEELERWWNQLVSALNYTHAQGIVHRDIKPSNVFIDKKGDVKLLDFGIAKVRESVLKTQTGAMMGTLMYMSPEQVQDSKHIGPESDSYSLAVTFIHLLTGKAPYDSTTSNDYAIRKGIVEQELDLSALPASWRGFLKPYLAKEPAKRPALRAFEATIDTSLDNNEGTIDDEKHTSPKTPHSGPAPLSPTPVGKSGPKKGLWIALAAIAAVVALFLKPKQESAPIDPDTRAYEACQTIDDYRVYLRDFGCNALHYAEATQFINGFEADSIIAEAYDAYDAQVHFTVPIEKDLIIKQFELRLLQQDSVDILEFFKPYFSDSIEIRTQEAKYKNIEDSSSRFKQFRIKEDLLNQLDSIKRQRNILSWSKNQKKARYSWTRNGSSELYLGVPAPQAQQQAQTQQHGGNSTTGTANGHEWVDLDLPSGTLWATCNIGASKPEGYGNYYAWGETSTKSTYNWDTYKYANGDYDKLTKYCNKSEYGNNGFTDNLTTLQSGDDPAASNWGSGWQTPSKAQWDELLANTTNQWTTRNGVKGRLFTSKKNSQTLFLPAAGDRWDSELHYAGSYGDYWSRSLCTSYPGGAWNLNFYSGGCDMGNDGRFSGFTVRPVRQK